MARKHLIATLTTDLGWTDPYLPAMKGTLLSICPRAQLVDICHDIPPHDVPTAAFILAHAAAAFPPDTVHVAAVDPGTGVNARVLAAQFGGQTFLLSDNGLITHLVQSMPLEALYVVRDARYLPPRSEGVACPARSVFAPLAGMILNGLNIRDLGPEPQTYKLLDLPAPHHAAAEAVGQVIYVDRFGNLVTNLSEHKIRTVWPHVDRLSVQCGERQIDGIEADYSFAQPGQAVATFNSMRLLEIGVSRGRASDVFAAAVGVPVRVTPRA